MSELLPIDAGQHRAKLTVRDFVLLDENGAFSAYRKTELIDGDVYFVNAQYRPHALVKTELYDAIRDMLRSNGTEARPVQEASLALSDQSMPEPDITVTNEPRGEGAIPLSSVSLLVEVSDTTLDMDLGRKLAIYAAAGVPEYWVADLNGRVIHQMWSPEGNRYAEHREVSFGEKIEAATLDGLVVQTAAL